MGDGKIRERDVEWRLKEREGTQSCLGSSQSVGSLGHLAFTRNSMSTKSPLGYKLLDLSSKRHSIGDSKGCVPAEVLQFKSKAKPHISFSRASSHVFGNFR